MSTIELVLFIIDLIITTAVVFGIWYVFSKIKHFDEWSKEKTKEIADLHLKLSRVTQNFGQYKYDQGKKTEE